MKLFDFGIGVILFVWLVGFVGGVVVEDGEDLIKKEESVLHEQSE